MKFTFEGLDRLHNMLRAAGDEAPQALRRAINHTGDKVRTAMVRELAAQTGLKVGLTRRALKTTRASDGGLSGFVAGAGSLDYVIKAKGSDIGLRYFKPVERGAGVVATVAGRKMFAAGAFKKSGPEKHRRINPKFHGNVLRNAAGGAWGGKMTSAKSGLYIAQEMISGRTAEAFYRVVERDLPARVEHELTRVLSKLK